MLFRCEDLPPITISSAEICYSPKASRWEAYTKLKEHVVPLYTAELMKPGLPSV